MVQSQSLADTEITTNLASYANRWVALVKNRVVGVGLTREQAYRTAKRARPKDKPQLLFINARGRPIQLVDPTTDNIQNWITQHSLVQKTVDILQAKQSEVYLVGGAVRDFLLGRPTIVDFDFAVPKDGIRVARTVANALEAAFYALDDERDTGRVVVEMPGGQKIYLDFATYRGDSLEADLADRDLTINAIALSLTADPQLIDPLHGHQDLETGQIRAVSENAFRRDPVRVLRAVRQTLDFGFSLEPQTADFIRQATSLLPLISPERQRDELLKLLNTPHPGQGIQMLQKLDVLPHILPEVEAMVGVTQSTPHHLTVFEHTIAALDIWARMVQANWPDVPHQAQVANHMLEPLAGNLTQQAVMPLALLLHDSGKPLTRQEVVTKDVTRIQFIGHEKESARIARNVTRRLCLSGQAADFVVTVVAQHMRPIHLAATNKISHRAIYRFFRDTTRSKYQAGVAVALHALADQEAAYPPSNDNPQKQALVDVVQRLIVAYFEQQAQVVDPPPLLTGKELINELGVPQGRLIGLLLANLKEAQASGEVSTRDEALAFIKAQPDFAQSRTDKL